MIRSFCCGLYEGAVLGWIIGNLYWVILGVGISSLDLSLQQISITGYTRLGSRLISPFGDPPSFEISMPKSLHSILITPMEVKGAPWTDKG